jgi:hypothetical protein
MKTAAAKSKVTRLTPKPEVLRELYLLSGNNCAMPGCKNVIIDRAGVVVGHICHIEAAMSDGARFNPDQTNEERRALSNLVLICAGHHAQIDSKKHEKKWSLAAVRKIKADHEKKFKGLDDSLQQAFQNSFVDSTDALSPTNAESFAELERLLPHAKVKSDKKPERKAETDDFLKKMALVPDEERQFMVSLIRRAIKLRATSVSVDVDDVKNVFKIGYTKIKKIGEALDRYRVGSVDEVGTRDGNRYHVMIQDPSDHLTWFEINEFCEVSGHDLDEFVLRLKFGLLDGPA